MRDALGEDILGDDMYKHVTYSGGDTMPQAVDIDRNRSENVQRITAFPVIRAAYDVI